MLLFQNWKKRREIDAEMPDFTLWILFLSIKPVLRRYIRLDSILINGAEETFNLILKIIINEKIL